MALTPQISAILSLALAVGCSSQAPNTVFDAGDESAPMDTGTDVIIEFDASEVPRPTDTNPPPDAQGDSGVDAQSPDAVDASDAAVSGPSAQIRAVQTAAAGAVNLTVSGAVVTYLTPGFGGVDGGVSGNDPAGFFVQAEMTGPALFVAVDPATLSPRPALGDRVSFHVTMTRSVNAGASRWVSALDMFARSESGVALAPLVQDLSAATDVVTGLNGYDSELITLTGTISGPAVTAGTSFMAFPITTAGSPMGDMGLRLRIPSAVIATVGAREGCRFTISQTPMWRFNAGAQPSAWAAGDIALTMCPPAMDGGVDAGTDAGTGTDATVDARTDTGTDAAVDARADVTSDVSTCAAHIVINEFAVAGPMGASDEFVELFNTGACTVNLEGWTLKYSASTGSAPATRWTGASGVSIAPGAYVVIAPATGSSYSAVRTASAELSLAAGGGAVGLFSATSAIPHDGVAYGTATATNPLIEGSTPAAAPSATQSASRIPNGADTNVNSADFHLSTAITAGAVNR